MSTIIPAAPDWRICFPGPNGRFAQVGIIAWHVDDDLNVVPITAFGLGDVSEGYVLATPDLFVRMPNGPFFNSYNDVAAYFAKAGAQ
jgi:hypothetical protein